MVHSSSHKWQHIRDYETDPCELEQKELRGLFEVWEDQYNHLEKLDAMSIFREKLHREWAIETGLIERIYTLDRGTTELMIERGIQSTLIPHGMVKNPEKVTSMIQDHQDAIEHIFQYVKDNRTLSTNYIKQLHSVLTQNQDTVEAIDSMNRVVDLPLKKGEYKTNPNNPRRQEGVIHEYCPPEHVSSEMDQLISMHLKHDSEAVKPEVEAAWLHHRFTQIHPFQDGNGRVARGLATLIFVRAGWLPPVIKSAEREHYISVLESADQGDLLPLVKLFARIERQEFVKAIGIAEQVIQSDRIDKFVSATKSELGRRLDSLQREWMIAKESAERLQNDAKLRLQEISQSLKQEMESLLPSTSFYTDGDYDQGLKSHYFYRQIIDVAKSLGYFANTQQYRAWTRLKISAKDKTDNNIIISFHGIGHEFRGVLACSAIYFQKVDSGDTLLENIPAEAISSDVFQINYKERFEEVRPRFRTWLEDSILKGLEKWQSTIL